MPLQLLTTGPSNSEVVTLAVFMLGGDKRPVDTEDVAVKAHELAPTRFSWRKYPDRINLELVRVYLSDAKKPDKGGYLDGSGRVGWSLTPAGLRWVQTAGRPFIGESLDRGREQAGGGPPSEQRFRRERTRLLTTRAWIQWSEGEGDVPLLDAEEVFRIDAYAVGRTRLHKIRRLQELLATDAQITAFLARMADILETAGGK